jgi:hypothetical protein
MRHRVTTIAASGVPTGVLLLVACAFAIVYFASFFYLPIGDETTPKPPTAMATETANDPRIITRHEGHPNPDQQPTRPQPNHELVHVHRHYYSCCCPPWWW